MHYSACSVTKPSPLLAALGQRVRSMRELRGWTRADLSQRSGVSQRFLARVEAGDGNLSLLRLEELCRALDTTPGAVLRPVAPASPLVALVGLRGAGKSTIGPLLAARLGAPFFEMDALIVDASGLPVDQIFELHGERFYRRLEREILSRLASRSVPAVLATAGGVVNEPASWDLLLERATTVWLRARAHDHWTRVVAQGDRRPMAQRPDAMAELRALLAARERYYGQAHIVVDTSGRNPESVVDDVARAIARRRDTMEVKEPGSPEPGAGSER